MAAELNPRQKTPEWRCIQPLHGATKTYFSCRTRFAAGVHLLKSRASYVDMRARSGRKRKSWEFLVFYGPGHYEIPPHVSHDGEDGHLPHSSSASRLTAGLPPTRFRARIPYIRDMLRV